MEECVQEVSVGYEGGLCTIGFSRLRGRLAYKRVSMGYKGTSSVGH